MQVKISINKEKNLITVTAGGNLSIDELAGGLVKVTSHPDFVAGQDVIWDLRGVETADMDTDDLKDIVEYVKGMQDKRGSGYKAALITSQDYIFGLARMYEAYVNSLPFKLRVFRNADEAYAWLGESRE
ncbi:MAG: hypothetical protein GY863_04790 [bacterium]|nr:hypothetical protein [bacterium]